LIVFVLATLLVGTSPGQSIAIDLAHGSDRERRTKARLEEEIASYDLSKYTFTREVVIDEGAMNHAFPVLTLNARFADSGAELLSSYVHEQLHWYLRAHRAQQQAAIAQLRRMYPNAPVGLPESAETAYSTYGHLVACYLEIQADRQLMGPERTAAIISAKRHYTWIYRTILQDESRIAAVVSGHGLQIK
jgi:hypothetical protein